MLRTILFRVFLLVAVSFITSEAQANLVQLTSGEQYVRSGIGYRSAGVDYPYVDQRIPEPPQGVGDTDLNISLAQYGVSMSSALSSVFGDDYFRTIGSGSASADWTDYPSGADDVHGGSGTQFTVGFSVGSSPTYLFMKGELKVVIDGSVHLHPEETMAYVRLSSKSGATLTKIWEIKLDGRDPNSSMPVSHGLWLDANRDYVLEAHARVGTMASWGDSSWKSRTARFSLLTAFNDNDVSDVYLLKDYFPLEEGITWNYLQTYDIGKRDYEVYCIRGTELIDDVVTSKRWEFDSGELEFSDYFYDCMAWTQEGLKMYKNVSSDGSYVTCSPPAILLPELIRVGETFQHSCTFTERDSHGSYIRSWPYSVEFVLEGEEDITVMAGKFRQCLKLSGTEEDEGEISHFTIWYAPRIGEVRRLYPGIETRELISYTSPATTFVPQD